jgi:hypothetical protein
MDARQQESLLLILERIAVALEKLSPNEYERKLIIENLQRNFPTELTNLWKEHLGLKKPTIERVDEPYDNDAGDDTALIGE